MKSAFGSVGAIVLALILWAGLTVPAFADNYTSELFKLFEKSGDAREREEQAEAALKGPREAKEDAERNFKEPAERVRNAEDRVKKAQEGTDQAKEGLDRLPEGSRGRTLQERELGKAEAATQPPGTGPRPPGQPPGQEADAQPPSPGGLGTTTPGAGEPPEALTGGETAKLVNDLAGPADPAAATTTAKALKGRVIQAFQQADADTLRGIVDAMNAVSP